MSAHDTLPPFEEIRDQYLPLLSREAADADPGRTSGVDWSEKVQVGLIALHEAYQHWSPEGGANFQTYATQAIRHALRKRIHEEKDIGLAGLPARESMRRRIARWEQDLGRSLDPEEIAVLKKKGDPRRQRILAQSEPTTIRRGDEHRPGPNERGYLKELISHQQEAQVLQALETVLHGRDQAIVRAWLGGASHKAIGSLVGVSGARISQLLPDLVAKVIEATPRMAAVTWPTTISTPDLIEPPVDRSLRPPVRPPEPPRFVRQDGDLIAHRLECLRDAEAIIAIRNRPGATLPWNVSCSPALGGCGAGSDVVDPHGTVRTISIETVGEAQRSVLPKTGLTPGLKLAPAVQAVTGPMDRVWSS